MKIYPDKNKAFPNPAIPSLRYIKNVVKNPRIIIGNGFGKAAPDSENPRTVAFREKIEELIENFDELAKAS